MERAASPELCYLEMLQVRSSEGSLQPSFPPSAGGAGRPQLPGDGALSSSSGSAKPACRLAASLPPKLS